MYIDLRSNPLSCGQNVPSWVLRDPCTYEDSDLDAHVTVIPMDETSENRLGHSMITSNYQEDTPTLQAESRVIKGGEGVLPKLNDRHGDNQSSDNTEIALMITTSSLSAVGTILGMTLVLIKLYQKCKERKKKRQEGIKRNIETRHIGPPERPPPPTMDFRHRWNSAFTHAPQPSPPPLKGSTHPQDSESIPSSGVSSNGALSMEQFNISVNAEEKDQSTSYEFTMVDE